MTISYLTYMQVPLDIVPQNETTSEGMAAILTHLHQYVPCITYTENKDGCLKAIPEWVPFKGFTVKGWKL